MATQNLTLFSATLIADDSNTAGTVVMRDSQGNIAGARLQGSELKSTGALTLSASASKTSAFTADATASFWPCNPTGGAFAATLPPASSCNGRVYSFQKTDSSGNAVTVTGNGAETIDGANTKVLSTQWSKTTIWSDGANWHTLA